MTDVNWQGRTAMTDPVAGGDTLLLDDVSDHADSSAGTVKLGTVDELLSMTTLGDTVYRGSSGPARLAGNTAAARKFYRQQGNGTVSAAPAWDVLQFGDLPNVLSPSGDATGATDSAAVTAACASAGRVILAAGQWHLSAAAVAAAGVWLMGVGHATVVNVVSGAVGLSVAVSAIPGVVRASDMQFVGGATGLSIAGADDCWFDHLYFTGQTVSSIKVNGDDATEMHFSDVCIRQAGGIGFDYERTTATTGNGGLYLTRVRIITPLSSCNYGFKFVSANASVTPAFLFMTECIADNIFGTAMFVQNIYSVLVSNSWFTVPASVTGTPSALHVTGGYQQEYNGSYFFNGSEGFDVILDGGAHEIQVGQGSVFDGDASTTALSVTAAGANILVSDYWNYCGQLADDLTKLSNLITQVVVADHAVTTTGDNALAWAAPAGLYEVSVSFTVESTAAGNMDIVLEYYNGTSSAAVGSASCSAPAGTTWQTITLTAPLYVSKSTGTVFVAAKASATGFTVKAASAVSSVTGASQVTMKRI